MKNLLIVSTLAAGLFALTAGCHHERRAEGPAERAGQSVDNAAHEVKEETKDAAHTTKEAVKSGAENTEDAAKKTKRDVKREADKRD